VYEILDNFRSWMTAKVWRRVVRTHPQAATPAAKTPLTTGQTGA
jgi:hypothetical protein